MKNNKPTFLDMKNFLVEFAQLPEGDDKQRIRESNKYQNALTRGYAVFHFPQREVIYGQSSASLEKELERR
ncbi:MAG: hypothetical protein KKH70_20450 [Gammaproteobacteria bacterium]|nr:hypothetical protein [Gammaproteobacteria bacterium]